MMNQTIRLDFVTKIFARLPEKENSVISPHGIAAVLSMAAEGASGDTLDEILTAFGVSSLEELRCAVVGVIAKPCNGLKSENSVELQKGTANIALREEFRQKLTCQYAAQVSEKNTKGDATVQLCNAATFRGEWRSKMKRDASGEYCFHNADGSTCRPAYLKCTDDMRYYRDDAFGQRVQAVALPYKSIPYELVLLAGEKPITQTLLQNVLANMRTHECEVEFPEFYLKSKYGLVSAMKSMGMRKMFDKDCAGLNRIATAPLYVAGLSQEAEIKVDQNGTVAIARTCMTMCLSSGILAPPKFTFRKPFSYFLRNILTGEIVFMGRVNKLSDCSQ